MSIVRHNKTTTKTRAKRLPAAAHALKNILMKTALAMVAKNRFLNKLPIFAQVHGARRHDIMAAFRTVDFSDRTKVTESIQFSSSLQVVQSHHGRAKLCLLLIFQPITIQHSSSRDWSHWLKNLYMYYVMICSSDDFMNIQTLYTNLRN